MADSGSRSTGDRSTDPGGTAGPAGEAAADSAVWWGPPGEERAAGEPSPGPLSQPPPSPRLIHGTGPRTSPIEKTPTVGQTLDGQGQVWEFDLGDRPAGPVPADEDAPDEGSDWAVDLDRADGWTDEGGRAEPVPPRRRLLLAATAVLAVLLAGLSVPGLLGDDDGRGDENTVVLGRHLATPVELTLPEGAVATADDSYIGVQFPSGGWVLVTVPEQVVQPDGTRIAMPGDPAAWLQAHPDVFVSAVRQVQVDGRSATQVDYRRSAMAEPQGRYARLSLFCGWRGDDLGDTNLYRTAGRECTQITDGARVRTTFIPVGGRTLLVEAVWRPYGIWGWRMPTGLRESYNELLSGLSPRPV